MEIPFVVKNVFIWNRVKLSSQWLKVTFWIAIYRTFATWFGILIAAIFNAGKMLTIVAKGQKGHPVAGGIVNFLLFRSCWLCCLFVLLFF